MDEAAIRAYIDRRITELQQHQAQAIAQVQATSGAIHELQQLLSGWDEPAVAPTELPKREVA